MSEIISLFTVFSPHLSTTTLRQFCRVVFAVLAMTGSVTMRNISRWTKKGGSYRTIQRFYNTLIPWGTLCWVFFRAHLYDPDDVYLLAGDETVLPKSGDETYGLSRFFSSTLGKTIRGLAFFAVSLIRVKQRRSYPMLMEQVVRGEASTPPKEVSAVSKTSETKGKPGRPKGSKNRNKTEVVLNDTLKQVQSMLKMVLATLGGTLKIGYFLLDGYFGNNNTLQMVRACGLHLISKLRRDAALYLPPTTPYQGRGRPAIYGEKFNPKEIDSTYKVSTQTQGNITTEVYQIECRHKRFPDPLNVVCLLKTDTKTQEKSHVLLFSSDLDLDAETMIDYYSLRFQIEFNFRDAKQFWGLDDFMNVKETPVNNAANLSMFMVNVSAKLREMFGTPEHPGFGVLDIKARYRGLKYLQETLKILPQKPEAIVIDNIAEHLASIGAIHYTSNQIRPG